MSHNIELDRLGQGTALSNSDNITLLDREARTAVGVNILVTLLITLVLGDVVEVVPANDNCTLHLGGDDKALDNLTTNGNVSGEGALLVNVVALNGCIGGFDSKPDVFDPSHGLHLFSVDITLTGNENCILRLVGFFVFCREPPPHDNGEQSFTWMMRRLQRIDVISSLEW